MRACVDGREDFCSLYAPCNSIWPSHLCISHHIHGPMWARACPAGHRGVGEMVERCHGHSRRGIFVMKDTNMWQ